MKVQAIEMMDMDGNPSVQLYIDGEPLKDDDYEIETIDPGRGWDWEDWLPRIVDAWHVCDKAESTKYDADVFEALVEGAEDKYVENKPENWRELVESLDERYWVSTATGDYHGSTFLGGFETEEEAAEFIGTLEGHEDGRYNLDDMQHPDRDPD